MEALLDFGDMPSGSALQEPDLYGRRLSGSEALRFGEHSVLVADKLLGKGQERFSERRHSHVVLVPFEELATELLFERSDMLGKDGLRDEEVLRRPCEVQRNRKVDELFNMLDSHHSPWMRHRYQVPLFQ